MQRWCPTGRDEFYKLIIPTIKIAYNGTRVPRSAWKG
jgi:hypothetical protein